jgi:mannose-1-phosphate guanylyltransferase
MPNRFVLVLAGGRGERFWPWSRPGRPKQLLPLAPRGRTLLAATLGRALRLAPAERILVLTARDLVPAVTRECAGSGVRVAGEPVARNTAAAIGAAAAWCLAHGGDPTLAVLPADHLIVDETAFAADFERAFSVAERDAVLLTFGIKPLSPDTGFGYIHVGVRIGERLHRVAQFREKPDRARAEEWLAAGGYLWNSGMFAWRAGVLLDALEAGRPGLAGPLRGLASDRDLGGFERGLDRVFPGLESISIDYAVLEHAPNTVMLEARFDWDDLGSWNAWARHQPRDDRGNVVFGDAVAVDCDRCVVVGDGGTAAALRLTDMVVVNAGGGTLACRLEDSADVRRVSEAIHARAPR